jgi:hypothetical protein
MSVHHHVGPVGVGPDELDTTMILFLSLKKVHDSTPTRKVKKITEKQHFFEIPPIYL